MLLLRAAFFVRGGEKKKQGPLCLFQSWIPSSLVASVQSYWYCCMSFFFPSFEIFLLSYICLLACCSELFSLEEKKKGKTTSSFMSILVFNCIWFSGFYVEILILLDRDTTAELRLAMRELWQQPVLGMWLSLCLKCSSIWTSCFKGVSFNMHIFKLLAGNKLLSHRA